MDGCYREKIEIVRDPSYGSLFTMFALTATLSSLPIRKISSRNNATPTRGHGVQEVQLNRDPR